MFLDNRQIFYIYFTADSDRVSSITTSQSDVFSGIEASKHVIVDFNVIHLGEFEDSHSISPLSVPNMDLHWTIWCLCDDIVL